MVFNPHLQETHYLSKLLVPLALNWPCLPQSSWSLRCRICVVDVSVGTGFHSSAIYLFIYLFIYLLTYLFLVVVFCSGLLLQKDVSLMRCEVSTYLWVLG